jgi:hypothetical protein
LKKLSLLISIYFFLLYLPASAVHASHEALLTLIPADNLAPGWVRSGEPSLCADENCLSQRLNGAAPFYFNAGLFISAYQYYLQKDGPGEINLEIFWMKTFNDAKFLYGEMGKEAAKSPTPPQAFKIGTGGRLLEAPGLYYLEYYLGPYYVRIEARGENLAPKEAALKMAKKIAKDIEEGKKNQ